MERRKFGEKSRPPKTWWQKILFFFRFNSNENVGFGGHHDRMQERKRKSKFDRW